MLKLGQNYDLLCNMIIRPPRFVYDIQDLGPRYFAAGGKPAQRTDFELRNGRGMIIQCSHFEPLTNWEHPMPCVIYLHGNGGCRIEALDVVHTLLPSEVSVLAVDFAGSGLSEGEYVSLGYWEQYDVATVVQYLREANRCSTIGLWGRSMGAVTAILYSIMDPSIASMILDSPFCSLQKIAEDLVLNIETLQKVPRFTKFAVNLAMKPIRSTIKKKAKFDIKALEILELISKCFIPALFVHGADDNFVLPMHSEILYDLYNGDKNRILVDGNHNSMRPNFFMDSAVIFFNNTLHNGSAPHQTSKASTLPELPLSMPQRQAEIQLQQFNDILHHPLHQPAYNTTTQTTQAAQGAQGLAQGTQVLAQGTQEGAQQRGSEEGQGVVMEEIDVGDVGRLQNNSAPQPTSLHNSSNGLHGSVIIDDMVIGNTVMIDGREVILDSDDQDQDAYYSDTPHSHPASSLSTTPLSSTPPHPFIAPLDSMPINYDQNNNLDNYHHEDNNTAIPLATTTTTTYEPPQDPINPPINIPINPPIPHHPSTSEAYIVHDNANHNLNGEDEEEIPEEIDDEDNNTNAPPTLSFRASSDMPEEFN